MKEIEERVKKELRTLNTSTSPINSTSMQPTNSYTMIPIARNNSVDTPKNTINAFTAVNPSGNGI